jgi:hypothetical protein
MTSPDDESEAADKALKQVKFLRNEGWHVLPQSQWNKVADLVEATTATLAVSLDWLKQRKGWP